MAGPRSHTCSELHTRLLLLPRSAPATPCCGGRRALPYEPPCRPHCTGESDVLGTCICYLCWGPAWTLTPCKGTCLTCSLFSPPFQGPQPGRRSLGSAVSRRCCYPCSGPQPGCRRPLGSAVSRRCCYPCSYPCSGPQPGGKRWPHDAGAAAPSGRAGGQLGWHRCPLGGSTATR